MDSIKKRIFLVDDDVTNLKLGKAALKGVYDVWTVPSADKLFELLADVIPDMVILDIDMPGVTGYDAIKRLKSEAPWREIPVIFLTGMNNTDAEVKGLSLGAVDYINKPWNAELLLKRIELHLNMEFQKRTLEEQRRMLQAFNENLTKTVEDKTRTVLELQSAIIKTMAELVEYRDDITGKHIENTEAGTGILIDALIKAGLFREKTSTWDIDLLLQSAQLHDVGKISISDFVLNKPSKLSDEEFDIIKTHAAEGERIIDEIMKKTEDDGFLMHAKMFAGYHHEKWDGSGYPRGLSGMDIPLQGRLMAIADVYDALVSDRPYKQAFTHEKAVEIIIGNSGTQFDPTLIEIFKQVSDEFWIENVAGSDSID
jgi:putative two-component system response regulator